MNVRPHEHDRVMVQFDIGGVPLSDVTKAGTVDQGSMWLQRHGSLREAPITMGTQATVLFTANRRLFHWAMRVEEVLPSSFYLTSAHEPGHGERREFVRAHVPMRGRLLVDGGWIEVPAIENLSAAGFRVPDGLPIPSGARVRFELRPLAGSDRPIQGVALALRTNPEAAFEFVELGSSDENRVSDLVFAAREAALMARLDSTGTDAD
ncbi:MAG: PilZ domain-containing protein [Myxococcales bacterium]|nr:PilZ domain-containing protein [Myxococcales bacterium]